MAADTKNLQGAGPHATGVSLGTSATDLVSLHGATPVVKRVGAAQAVVDATVVAGAAGANPTQAEYAVAVAKINALVVLCNELRAALVEKGIIKGAA